MSKWSFWPFGGSSATVEPKPEASSSEKPVSPQQQAVKEEVNSAVQELIKKFNTMAEQGKKVDQELVTNELNQSIIGIAAAVNEITGGDKDENKALTQAETRAIGQKLQAELITQAPNLGFWGGIWNYMFGSKTVEQKEVASSSSELQSVEKKVSAPTDAKPFQVEATTIASPEGLAEAKEPFSKENVVIDAVPTLAARKAAISKTLSGVLGGQAEAQKALATSKEKSPYERQGKTWVNVEEETKKAAEAEAKRNKVLEPIDTAPLSATGSNKQNLENFFQQKLQGQRQQGGSQTVGL